MIDEVYDYDTRKILPGLGNFGDRYFGTCWVIGCLLLVQFIFLRNKLFPWLAILDEIQNRDGLSQCEHQHELRLKLMSESMSYYWANDRRWWWFAGFKVGTSNCHVISKGYGAIRRCVGRTFFKFYVIRSTHRIQQSSIQYKARCFIIICKQSSVNVNASSFFINSFNYYSWLPKNITGDQRTVEQSPSERN